MPRIISSADCLHLGLATGILCTVKPGKFLLSDRVCMSMLVLCPASFVVEEIIK